MDAADDPDPGEPIHPSVFYGLWPRFTADEEAAEPADAEPGSGIAD